MLRQRLFNTGLLQLFLLGMRMTSTADLAQQIIQSRLNLNNFDDGDIHHIPGDNEELTCLWKLLDHTILLSCILCLLHGTRDDNETPKVHKSLILRFWMLIAVMYNWGFCIATAIQIDWVNWTLDEMELDLGQLTFVLFNSAIFIFIGRYIKRIGAHMGNENGSGLGQLSSVYITTTTPQNPSPTPPKLPKANPPIGRKPRKSGNRVLKEVITK